MSSIYEHAEGRPRTTDSDGRADDQIHVCWRSRSGKTHSMDYDEHAQVRYAADLVVTAPGQDGGVLVLLIRRKYPPYASRLALPGGHVDLGETSAEAAARELDEETGVVVDEEELRLIGTYDAAGRDPRGRVISKAYRVRLTSKHTVRAGDDAAAADWYPVTEVLTGEHGQLAFDHQQILADAIPSTPVRPRPQCLGERALVRGPWRVLRSSETEVCANCRHPIGLHTPMESGRGYSWGGFHADCHVALSPAQAEQARRISGIPGDRCLCDTAETERQRAWASTYLAIAHSRAARMCLWFTALFANPRRHQR